MARTAGGLSLVIATAAAGFAMSFAHQAPPGGAAAAERPGTCHLAQDPNELVAIASDTASPVPCTQPHQIETMFVAQVTGFLAAARTRPNSELLNRFAGRQCFDYDRERAYLGAGPSDNTSVVTSYARYPTVAAWARGDRTVSCEGSTSAESPSGPTTDFALAGVMRSSHSALFRGCEAAGGTVTCLPGRPVGLPSHTGPVTQPDHRSVLDGRRPVQQLPAGQRRRRHHHRHRAGRSAMRAEAW